METIAGDIRTWSWFSTPHGYNFNGFLVPHPQGNICIDPVQASASDLEEIDRARPTRPQVCRYSLRLCRIPRHQEQSCPTLRVSPGDSLRDARRSAHDEDSLNH